MHGAATNVAASGTLATHNVGMVRRSVLHVRNGHRERAYSLPARPALQRNVANREAHVNGDMEQRVPHNLNISFNFVEANR